MLTTTPKRNPASKSNRSDAVPRPSEGHVPAQRELQRRHPAAGRDRRILSAAAGSQPFWIAQNAPDLHCLSSPHHKLVEPRLGGPYDFRVHRLDQPFDRWILDGLEDSVRITATAARKWRALATCRR